MQVSKNDGKAITKALDNWRGSGLISEELHLELQNSVETISFDWKRLAKYSFWLAIGSLLISLFTIITDEWLIEFFKRMFSAPALVKSIGFGLCSAVLYYVGVSRGRKNPSKPFSSEAIVFLGVASTAASITFLGQALEMSPERYSDLLLTAAIVYGVIGLLVPSGLVWVFSLLSLGSWFGTETGYMSGWGAYYLGMNYPLRFVAFGLVLIGVGVTLGKWEIRSSFKRPTMAVGMLYLFVALWILSIFGNHGDFVEWQQIKQIELFHWSVLFAVVAIASVMHGLKYEDGMTKGFGLTFLCINVYTRAFEHFWLNTHKAIFFSVLALSFWFIGRKAETIWQLRLKRN